MIYICNEYDKKSNFDAAKKYNDNSAVADILTDNIARLIANRRTEVIQILYSNDFAPANNNNIEAITDALSRALQKSVKVRKLIAELMVSEKTSSSEGQVLEALNNPETQQNIQDLVGSIFNLFGKNEEKAKAATNDIKTKTQAHTQTKAPKKKNYTGYYLAGAAVVGVLSIVLYKVLKPKANATAAATA